MDNRQTGRNIYFKLIELLEQNKSCVLCTVTATKGSTPQKPGSSAVFDEKGLVLGTVGGGSVEHIIQKKAAAAIQDKNSGISHFDLDNEISEEEAAICGGGMSILLDASPEKHVAVFEEIRKDIGSQKPGVLLSLVSETQTSDTNIKRMWITSDDQKEGMYGLQGTTAGMVEDMLNTPVSGDFREIDVDQTKPEEKQVVFLESVLPLPKLLIAGAGHVGKAVSQFAGLLDFEVIVWDERKEYANKENLPYANKILTGKMDTRPADFKVDRNTFVVIVTPGHKNDSAVLKSFIGSEAGYIGMIGSKKKIAQVKKKFLSNGWATKEQWDKVYTPIGLEIHSKTVPEIAVSIVAQLIKVRFELNQNG